MMMELRILSALGAFALVFGLACGKSGISTTQKPDGQVTTCFFGGKTYNPGDSFQNDCNTCSCGSNGQIGCTLLVCLGDAGSLPATPDAALPDAPGDAAAPTDQSQRFNDAQLKDATPAADAPDVAMDLRPDLRPAADSCRDVPRVEDAAQDSKSAADVADAGADTPDAPTLVCSLSSPLTFGYTGGNVLYETVYTLDGGARITATRNYLRGITDGPTVRSCSPTLPTCGSAGVVSISTIAQDLTDADVQLAFGLTTSRVYGIDSRPWDGAIWSITRAGGGNILVGNPCPSPATSSCQPIPPGIQRLTDDLKSLAAAAVAAPECSGL
jgi:hypothetical protein